MNKRISMIFTIAAVAVMGATLFGSTYTQSQVGGSSFDISKMDSDVMTQIHDMGGLELVMPQAFADVDCAMDYAGRTVVDFDVTGESAELPIMGGGTYSAMTFSGQVPGPTLRVTQGDVVRMTLTIPEDEPTPHGIDMHASQMHAGNFDSILPGESVTYCYIAEVPGVYKYHCSGVKVAALDQHVLSGMYGIAGDPFGLNPVLLEAGAIEEAVPSYAYVLGNPSDAVPPMGMNSIEHPKLNLHGLYTDERAAELKAELGL